MKFQINDEVYYGSRPEKEIYIIIATKDNLGPNDWIKWDSSKWDYLISLKGGSGFIEVKEDLIRKEYDL